MLDVRIEVSTPPSPCDNVPTCVSRDTNHHRKPSDQKRSSIRLWWTITSIENSKGRRKTRRIHSTSCARSSRVHRALCRSTECFPQNVITFRVEDFSLFGTFDPLGRCCRSSAGGHLNKSEQTEKKVSQKRAHRTILNRCSKKEKTQLIDKAFQVVSTQLELSIEMNVLRHSRQTSRTRSAQKTQAEDAVSRFCVVLVFSCLCT